MLRLTTKIVKIPVSVTVRGYYKTFKVSDKYLELVPALGESITEGTIAKWMKQEGEKVAVEDVLAVIETDKVTVDIKATQAGVLMKKLATDLVDLT